ncbi:succinylglutamate desuccinylase [Ferrimonas marina]|uniref:Succinylglutamate desuccinylase n=1 Tax=Ferrimonas marina TaxID=299255 RepID=A0A1M5Z3W5_9GAMM|nr:succinylglutamate desuccinylase [Ferrimonas marina]SHI18814.1 succinylglutamate desuccinylase [Ferrimonas marina]
MLQKEQDLLAMTLASPGKLDQPERFTLADDVTVSVDGVGIVRFEPAQPSELDLVLSAGVHGNETAPIELVNTLVQGILQGAIRCRCRLLVLLGNPHAMVAGQRELEHNLNRLFSGAHRDYQGSEADRAEELEQAVSDFFAIRAGRRCHYDLHTAIRASQREKFAIYPYRHGRPWKREQIGFLGAAGVDTILLSHDPTHTFSYFSSDRFGADAFTVELGRVRPFGQNDPSRLSALKAQLTALIEDRPVSYLPQEQVTVFDVAQVINKGSDAFTLCFPDDAANFTAFEPGTVLAQDGGRAVRVGAQPEAIVFPNAKVAVGQRACLTVVPVGPEQPFE